MCCVGCVCCISVHIVIPDKQSNPGQDRPPAEYSGSQRAERAPHPRHHSISLPGLGTSLSVATVTSVGWVNNLGVSQGLVTGVQIIEGRDYQVKFVSEDRSNDHHQDGGEGEGEDYVDDQLPDVLIGSLKC